jgi:hypothetical protein
VVNAYGILVGNLKRRYYLGNLGICGGIVFKEIVNKQNVRAWIRFICSGYGPTMGSCETSGSIKRGKFVYRGTNLN